MALGTLLPPRLPVSDGPVTTVGPGDDVAKAIAGAPLGSVVELAAGTYTARVTSSRKASATRPVTVRPAAGAKATMLRGFNLDGAVGIRVTGQGGHLLVDGAGRPNDPDLNVRVFRCASVEISFLELAFCSQPFYLDGGTDVHVLGNLIHDAGADANKEHGLYWGYGTILRPVVAGNLVVRTRARGLQFYSGTFRDGFVVCNTVALAGRGNMGQTAGTGGSEGHGLQVNPGTGWVNMTTVGNVVTLCSHTGYDSRNGVPAGGRFERNLGFACDQGVWSWDGLMVGNIEKDPMLDLTTWVPLPGSPCLAAGIPELTPPYGPLGVLRAAADLGAVPGATVAPPPDPDPDPDPEPEPEDPCAPLKTAVLAICDSGVAAKTKVTRIRQLVT